MGVSQGIEFGPILEKDLRIEEPERDIEEVKEERVGNAEASIRFFVIFDWVNTDFPYIGNHNNSDQEGRWRARILSGPSGWKIREAFQDL